MSRPSYLVSPEAEEQKAVMAWVEVNKGRYPELEFLFHVPNGEKREPWVGKKLKEMGVKKGVPDFMMLVPKNGFHGFLLEMKRVDGGEKDLSEEQKRFLTFENRQGYATCIGRGHEDAIRKIEAYLQGRLK